MKLQQYTSEFVRKHDLFAVMLVFLTAFLGLIFPNYVHAAEADTSIISEIVKEFHSQSSEIVTVISQYALKLFGLAATLEVAFLGIRAALGQAEIGETLKNFAISVIAAGFFLAVINNYQDWSSAVIGGLQTIAGEVNTIENSSDNPFKMGTDIATNLLAAIENLAWDDIAAAFGLLLSAIIVFITFCLITAQIIFIKCEAYIAMASACLLVGLGATSFFRNYAINVLRYIVSVAFKLMVMQLVIGIGYTYIAKLPTQTSGSSVDISIGLAAVGVAVVLYALVKSLPDTVAGIINGSHIGSGGLASAMRTVALGTMGVGMAMAATAKNVNYAHKAASAQGAQGFLGHAGSMASNLYSAWRQSAHGKEGTSMGNALRERIAASEAPSMPSMSSMSSSLLSSGSGGSSSGSSGSVSSMSGGSSGGGGMVSGSASGGASAASGSSGASNLSARIGAMTGATLAGATLGGAASNLSGGVSGSFSGGGSSVVRGGASAASGDASSPGQTKISGKIQDN